MIDTTQYVPVGLLCRIPSRDTHKQAIDFVQQFAETECGGQLSRRAIRELRPILCEIDDAGALREAIAKVRTKRGRKRKEPTCASN